jgi:hypothetical protein
MDFCFFAIFPRNILFHSPLDHIIFYITDDIRTGGSLADFHREYNQLSGCNSVWSSFIKQCAIFTALINGLKSRAFIDVISPEIASGNPRWSSLPGET